MLRTPAPLIGALGSYPKVDCTFCMNANLLEQATKLPVEERIALIEALWDSISERGAVPSLTDTQRAELDRRLVDLETNPDDVVAWDEVKAAALDPIGG